MKMPIEWHEECLRNNRISLSAERASVVHAVARLERSEEQTADYAAQIERAKSEGKKAFDPERYGVKRCP